MDKKFRKRTHTRRCAKVTKTHRLSLERSYSEAVSGLSFSLVWIDGKRGSASLSIRIGRRRWNANLSRRFWADGATERRDNEHLKKKRRRSGLWN